MTPEDLDECLINAIDVSPHDKATAYIATTRYKFDDKRPGIYKTTDYGETWTKITEGIPNGSYTRVVREDDQRKGLLFAGTETGLYISWNGGQQWQPFQLNLPATPILDLIIRHGDVIVATSGRSFWILDDLGLIRQWKEDRKNFELFQPEEAMLSNHGSELNQNDKTFKGSHPLRGVNPANGVVIYYTLPELPESKHIELEIRDSTGNLVNQFSSEEDKTFKKYAGGPKPAATLPKEKGLNRFVWDMRHQTMPGIPTAYIEGSYRRHKAIPGKYQLTLKQGEESLETTVEILSNPLYSTTPEQYAEYHRFMSEMEQTLTDMHDETNRLFKIQNQLKQLLATLPKDEAYAQLKEEGEALAAKLKQWDEEMVQRKSKAYDDVENFPNKFTAEYLFLINQTESDIPRVTQASKDRRTELDAQWKAWKQQADGFVNTEIPTFNQKLWKKKIGAIWMSE